MMGNYIGEFIFLSIVFMIIVITYYISVLVDITHGQEACESQEEKVIETKVEFWISIIIPFSMWAIFIHKKLMIEAKKMNKRYIEFTH